jgi:transposase
LTTWRRQRSEGILDSLSPKKRGRKAKKKNPLAERVGELERENQRLRHKLKQAETIIEVQKKVSQLLGIPLDSSGSDEGNS